MKSLFKLEFYFCLIKEKFDFLKLDFSIFLDNF